MVFFNKTKAELFIPINSANEDIVKLVSDAEFWRAERGGDERFYNFALAASPALFTDAAFIECVLEKGSFFGTSAALASCASPAAACAAHTAAAAAAAAPTTNSSTAPLLQPRALYAVALRHSATLVLHMSKEAHEWLGMPGGGALPPKGRKKKPSGKIKKKQWYKLEQKIKNSNSLLL